MLQIIPTVLATSEDQYKRDIDKFARSSSLQNGWVHLDFMDNKFVPNKGIDPSAVKKYGAPFIKEAHLMVVHPKKWLSDLVEAEFKRAFFHIEAEDDTAECLELGQKMGLEMGLVLNHETLIEKLEPFVSKIRRVLMMTIIPGFQGQPFIEASLEKIRQLKAKNWPLEIGVDGSVKDTNIKSLADAGVDFVIVGSYLLKGNTEENLERLWEAVYE